MTQQSVLTSHVGVHASPRRSVGMPVAVVAVGVAVPVAVAVVGVAVVVSGAASPRRAVGVRVAEGTDPNQVYNQPSNRHWLREGQESLTALHPQRYPNLSSRTW